MPITPHFHLSQTLTHVSVEIRVPHVRVTVDSVEVLVEDDTFHFSSPPYLLILTFPAPLAETDCSETAKYDPSREGGMISIQLKKKEPDLWPDFDLLGRLMRPKGTAASTLSAVKPLSVQVLSDESFVGVDEDDDDDESLPPNVLEENKPHYGFLNQFVGIFTDIVREGLATEMLQLPNPDGTDARDRRKLRLLAEEAAFDADRYIGDLQIEDDYIYQSAMSMEPHWRVSVESLARELSFMTTVKQQQTSYFTEDERAKLASISYPIISSTIDEHQQQSLLLGLLDILFAYVYDHLSTDGDPTIESSWTLCTLSCTLSWLESFDPTDGLRDVIRFSSRRSLIYPYIRNHGFSSYCWDQVAAIIKNGRRCIIRCLLQARDILDKSEFHYLGNRLYIDPYLAWIQNRLTDTTLSAFARDLHGVRNNVYWINKDAIGLPLIPLEQLLDAEDEDEIASDDIDEGETLGRFVERINDKSVESDEDLSESASILKSPSLHSENLVVSSGLLDSEIGGHGLLKIKCDMTGTSSGLKSPPVTVKPLIQEI
jgi:protein SHQ1